MRSLTNLTLSCSVDRMLILFDIDFLRYRLLLINSRWIETLCTACSKEKAEKITLKIYTICKALLMYTCSKQRGEIFWNNKKCPIYLHNNNFVLAKSYSFTYFKQIFFFFTIFCFKYQPIAINNFFLPFWFKLFRMLDELTYTTSNNLRIRQWPGRLCCWHWLSLFKRINRWQWGWCWWQWGGC